MNKNFMYLFYGFFCLAILPDHFIVNDFLGFRVKKLYLYFRNSLYNHHRYHIKNGNISKRFKLSKRKFSFNNIHMNIGNVRWYSVNRSIKENKVKSLVSTNYIFNELSYGNKQSDSKSYFFKTVHTNLVFCSHFNLISTKYLNYLVNNEYFSSYSVNLYFKRFIQTENLHSKSLVYRY